MRWRYPATFQFYGQEPHSLKLFMAVKGLFGRLVSNDNIGYHTESLRID